MLMHSFSRRETKAESKASLMVHDLLLQPTLLCPRFPKSHAEEMEKGKQMKERKREWEIKEGERGGGVWRG